MGSNNENKLEYLEIQFVNNSIVDEAMTRAIDL